jgi:uncharacterized protein (TIGR02266 family)
MAGVKDSERTGERRKDARVAARVEVRFNAREDAAKALRAYSVNLSAGGLALRTQRSYAVGMPLRLLMDVGGEVFELDAAVAWVRPEAIGVRFVNVRPEDRERLKHVITDIKPE